jgi:HK97 family phage prohead protease
VSNKTFKLEIKEFGDSQGTFTGLASVYGNKDLGGDIVEPGAFTKTLADKSGEVPILWQHDMREPIGLGRVTDTAEGLRIKGELALESPVAQKAYGLLKRGVLKGLSIGYDTIREEMKGTTRFLKELKLWEVSIVTFPMNELATVTGIKQLEDAKLELAEFIENEKFKFKALSEQHAAVLKALVDQIAAKHDKDAPNLHPSLDRISQLLRES